MAELANWADLADLADMDDLANLADLATVADLADLAAKSSWLPGCQDVLIGCQIVLAAKSSHVFLAA